MRHANVSTTMNVCGNSTLKAKQKTNSQVVQMLMRHDNPQVCLLWGSVG